MPRFYFHLRNDLSVNDEEGQVLPDQEAAMMLARKYAREMAAASILDHGRINLQHRIEVVDEVRETAFIVEYKDVVEIKG